jgi:hypothetical protein
MTRKDYIILAEALRNAGDIHVSDDFQRGKKTGVAVAVEFVADALQRDNSRFNREHFLSVVHGEKDLQSHPMRTRIVRVRSCECEAYPFCEHASNAEVQS